MSRIRKLSDGDQISLRKLRYRTPSSQQIPVHLNPKHQYSPYREGKLGKSPSFQSTSTKRQLDRSSSSNKTRLQESKLSFRTEDLSFSAARNGTWDKLMLHQKIIREKMNAFEPSAYSEKNHSRYVELFDDIIERDLIFADVLVRIKGSYTDLIQKLTNDASALIKQVEQLTEQKAHFSKMLDRIVKENYDLGKEVQKLENICHGLQSTLKEIQNIDLKKIPQDPEKWKAIIYENSEYCNMIYELKLDLKEFQFKESKMLQLIAAIKNRGVDVDGIFDSEVKNHDSFLESSHQISLFSQGSQKVPSLNLSSIHTNHNVS
jgi:hypothetical protein